MSKRDLMLMAVAAAIFSVCPSSWALYAGGSDTAPCYVPGPWGQMVQATSQSECSGSGGITVYSGGGYGGPSGWSGDSGYNAWNSGISLPVVNVQYYTGMGQSGYSSCQAGETMQNGSCRPIEVSYGAVINPELAIAASAAEVAAVHARLASPGSTTAAALASIARQEAINASTRLTGWGENIIGYTGNEVAPIVNGIRAAGCVLLNMCP